MLFCTVSSLHRCTFGWRQPLIDMLLPHTNNMNKDDVKQTASHPCHNWKVISWLAIEAHKSHAICFKYCALEISENIPSSRMWKVHAKCAHSFQTWSTKKSLLAKSIPISYLQSLHPHRRGRGADPGTPRRSAHTPQQAWFGLLVTSSSFTQFGQFGHTLTLDWSTWQDKLTNGTSAVRCTHNSPFTGSGFLFGTGKLSLSNPPLNFAFYHLVEQMHDTNTNYKLIYVRGKLTRLVI